MHRWKLLAIAVLAAIAAVPSAQAHNGGGKHNGGDKEWTVVASGLDNPRGINFDKHGDLWIAEAGRGGAAPCLPGEEPGSMACFGTSGAYTVVHDGEQSRVVTGLPSIADQGAADGTGAGNGALGVSDILPTRKGLIGLVGAGANPTDRAALAEVDSAANLFGWVVKVNPWKGSVWPFADLLQYEADNNPDLGDPTMGGIDSNIYGLTERHKRLIVADAGGNDVLSVKHKHISTLAVFPKVNVPFPTETDQFPMDAVPTSVAVRHGDPDIYVGQLTGFPFPPGAASVWRIKPDGTTEVFASGFTNIVDIVWGPSGSLYVVEIAKKGLASDDPAAGAIVRVSPDGQDQEIVASDGLVNPTAIAFAKDGTAYVANHGAEAGVGEVLNIGKI